MSGILVTDHAELDALGRDLLSAFDRGAAPEVLAKLDLVWARLAVHIRAEHLHLFPALLDASGGAAAGPSSQEVEEALSKLVGSSRVDLQACKLEYSIVSPK